MRAQAMAGRSRLLLAVLPALLGAGAAVAPAAAGYPAAPASSVHTGTVGAAPAVQDELRDWLRLSGAARHAHATALPDTWSAVCPQDPGASGPQGGPRTGDARAERAARGPATARSSRAPPRA